MHMVSRSRMPLARTGRAGAMLIPLLGALSVLAIGVAAVAIVLQLQEREKRQAKERELHFAQSENENLKTQLEETKQEALRTQDELDASRRELTLAQDELVRSTEAQDTLTQSVEDREQEIARLTADLDQAKETAGRAAKQLASLRKEQEESAQELADLQEAKAALETKVMELSERPTVELEKVRVAGEYGGAGMVMPVSARSLDGQVVVVNREYDFIVMNLGKNHGLSIGQEFQIIRGEEVLGHVKVEKVYDELSAAALLPDSKKGSIREGDQVTSL